MKAKNLSLLLPALAYSKELPEPTIREILKAGESTPKTWKSGITEKFHPDSKPSDYNLHSILNFDENAHINNPHPAHRVPKVADGDIPANFDPREKWGAMCPTLFEITDQGPCASSWAMAGATAFADRACIQTNGEINHSFSTQDVLECCHGCTPFGGGCEGGYMPQNWISFKNYGVVSGGLYGSNKGCKPYELQPCEHGDYDQGETSYPSCDSFGYAEKPVCNLACSNPEYPTNYQEDEIKLDNYYGITSHLVEDIQKELMTNGPIETTFHIHGDFLTYTGGVYYHTDGRKELYTQSVKLMGWGHDEESDLDYWLVANSWNADWGEDGFFRVKRGHNECSIEGTMYTGNMPGWEIAH